VTFLRTHAPDAFWTPQIAEALGEVERESGIGTTLRRLVAAGRVVRVAPGLFRALDEAAEK
jgi:hypothetical protein